MKRKSVRRVNKALHLHKMLKSVIDAILYQTNIFDLTHMIGCADSSSNSPDNCNKLIFFLCLNLFSYYHLLITSQRRQQNESQLKHKIKQSVSDTQEMTLIVGPIH